jgi:hypothetical protein
MGFQEARVKDAQPVLVEVVSDGLLRTKYDNLNGLDSVGFVDNSLIQTSSGTPSMLDMAVVHFTIQRRSQAVHISRFGGQTHQHCCWHAWAGIRPLPPPGWMIKVEPCSEHSMRGPG